jgi:hypothetical protein
MKMQYMIIAAFFACVLSAAVPGCKYNVTEPKWNLDPSYIGTSTITGVSPVPAIGGIGTLTITGTNFGTDAGATSVYFDTAMAEIKSITSTQIVVYRPSYCCDTGKVKITTGTSYNVTKYSQPVELDTVVRKYGSFTYNTYTVDTLRIYSMSADASGNLYAVTAYGAGNYEFFSVTASGSTMLAQIASFRVTEMRWHNGYFYLIGGANNAKLTIYKMTTTGIKTTYTVMPTNRCVSCGDFGSTGYLYVGGWYRQSSDLCTIAPTSTSSKAVIKYSGSYTTDTIQAIRVYNGYVYVASRSANSTTTKIFRHAIDADSVKAQETVLDLGNYGINSSVTGLAFSSTGIMYITINNKNPLLVYDGATLDYYYKGMILGYGKQCFWNGNYLYLSTNPSGSTCKIQQLDMGSATGATQY